MKPHQQGFGALAAVVVLVLLALVAASVVRLSQSSQLGMAQEAQAAHAQAAVRAGVDWGLYQVFRGTWQGCTGGQSQTLDLRAEGGNWVTVSCSAPSPYQEGQLGNGNARQVRVITLSAVACNAPAGPCPDDGAAAGAHYVERAREVVVAECTQEDGSWGNCPS
ncbi:MSHA biogenesis protein MshP [Inhella gelatinilytica]|uniref:MSHA biogenesis protein MshP n=1 Tax=Inhella gelatinilytica TaxID=2795030 RepID=A0A931IUP2_9BURK|nr:MSHA biogenesis protein MshP [Inhella gelatinilytica]MBH9551324.1 MSHA biogenesis protein MshP [Inhella gelatinilytica]